ncbi:hypothetical protein HXX76_011645 [Chlamydomonas incerta]|uniref:Uncharacterized protein n=1 Tax=Chlamydomonas incerta TaxID=51695 RepID=A0A835VPE4_CHLIN|nr:hypothetical protein HXX76_011645 [Chlamydomonas incerta]|eukprot:KAG2422830.1 hypothetical protein HXX76_011645 [Chlamydomonas incerta]
MTAVGIPADSCSPCVPLDCLKESFDGQFNIPGAANNVLTVSGCNAKPQVVGAVPLVFSTTTGSSFATVNAFLASSTTGQSVGVACYPPGDTTYTTISYYIFINHVATPSDNFACTTCDFYNVFKVTVGTCRCSSDTAWAVPLAPIFQNLVVGTGENALPSPYPAGVYWTARADASKANAWGGYFRIALPPHSTSVEYPMDVCAGCGQNRISAGFILARLIFRITNTGGWTSVTSFLAPSTTFPTYTPSLTAKGNSSVLHMYQSFIAPPTLTPGQFQKFTDVSAVTLPIVYGNTWSVTNVLTGSIKTSSGTYSVPAAETSSGLYVAIHLTVGGSFCA